MLTLTHKQAFTDSFIDMDEVEKRAPSAFTKGVANRASSIYVPIPTPDIIKDDLMRHNWFPIDAYQVSPKKEENKGFQKHFIRLRNPSIWVGKKNEISIVPELLLINSYDARCSIKYYISLHRVVCRNNIVVTSEEFEAYNMPHKGTKHNSYNDDCLQVIFDDIKKAVNLINNLSKVELTLREQKAFAQECCRARWDYKYQLTQPINLVQPIRPEDEGNDLFTVFNRIQEKLIKGNWVGGGGRKIKPILNVNRELIINCKLFAILENYYSQIIKTKI